MTEVEESEQALIELLRIKADMDRHMEVFDRLAYKSTLTTTVRNLLGQLWARGAPWQLDDAIQCLECFLNVSQGQENDAET